METIRLSTDDTVRPSESLHSLGDKTEDEYPEGFKFFGVVIGLVFAVFCFGLDNSILSTAIPEITSEFNSLGDVGWYGSSYLLTGACFQLMYGKLYAEFSTKWVFLTAMVIFEVGSVVCAAAPNSLALIVGRAIAGMGSSGLLSGGLTILAQTLPVHKRPKYVGLVGAASGIAQVIAPLLGGVFTDQLSWRWCFWINLPFGGLSVASILFLLRLPARPKSNESMNPWALATRLDLVGTLILMPAIISLLLALQWGGTTYAWSNWRLVLCLCLFAVLTLVFVYHQYRCGDKATVPLRIIRQRSVAAGCLFMLTCFSSLFLYIYYVPIWFQSTKGASAQQAGINFLATSAAMSVASVSSGFLTAAIGYYVPQMILGTIIMSAGAGMVYTFQVTTSSSFWIPSLILIGLGGGIGLQSPMMAAQTVLKGKDVAIGLSVLVFCQTLSGSIFLSVGSNILDSRLVVELAALVPAVDPQVVIANGAAGLRAAMEKAYPQYVDGILEAYNLAIRRVLLVALILTCLTAIAAGTMEWKDTRRQPKPESFAMEAGQNRGERPSTAETEAVSGGAHDEGRPDIFLPGAH